MVVLCEESFDEHLMTVDEESSALMMAVEGLADSSKDDEGSEAALLACVGLPNQSMAYRRCWLVDDCHSS